MRGRLGGLTGGGFIETNINATVGGAIRLLVLELVRPGQQLGGGRRWRRSRR